jgi:predicted enzyme related to lactoylglutathione lyase
MLGNTNKPALVVFPVKDVTQATAFYSALLGVEPYVSSPYYVGFKTDDQEIGLDPNGQHTGPLVYWDVNDINASLDALTAAGGQVQQEPMDVGGGGLIATVKDADGNLIGLRMG